MFTAAYSQVIEVGSTYGYQFGSTQNYGPNQLKYQASSQFGVTLGLETYPGLMAELSYINIRSELRLRDVIISSIESRISDLNMDWFLLGATQYLKKGKVKPYLGVGVGLAIVSPSNENRDILDNNLDSTTRLAFSFKGGINIMLSKVIGIKLQGDTLFPLNWAGVYIGPGGTGISTGSTLILGSLSAGLVFRLDNNNLKSTSLLL